MISTGFPGDEDPAYAEDRDAWCPKIDCDGYLEKDLLGDWYCPDCEKKKQQHDSGAE